MAEQIPFRLHLTGDTADFHQFQGYDGYMSLAGFALTLSLIANYAETGEIRWRGDFPGRHAVRAYTPQAGSFVADFVVWLEKNPARVLGLSNPSLETPHFFYELVRRIVARNLGENPAPNDALLAELLRLKGGDVEALVARTEAPIRQAHSVIGNGALSMDILGGYNVLGNFNPATREYVRASVEEETTKAKDFTVNAFSANNGGGAVFDSDLGRSVPFSMTKEILKTYGPVFSWGLDEYVRRTNRTIRMTYSRVLALDGRPKRYVVEHALRTPGQ